MIFGLAPFAFTPFGLPDYPYAGATLTVDASLTIAPTTPLLQRLARGEALIYAAEITVFGVSDRSG